MAQKHLFVTLESDPFPYQKLAATGENEFTDPNNGGVTFFVWPIFQLETADFEGPKFDHFQAFSSIKIGFFKN